MSMHWHTSKVFRNQTIYYLSFLSFNHQLILLSWYLCQVQTVCSSDCICDQPAGWETEELLLNHLEEVEISGLRGSEHEFAFVKRLFNWGTKLKEITVTFFIQPLKSRPRSCTKYFRVSLGPKYAWNFTCIGTLVRCYMHLRTSTPGCHFRT